MFWGFSSCRRKQLLWICESLWSLKDQGSDWVLIELLFVAILPTTEKVKTTIFGKYPAYWRRSTLVKWRPSWLQMSHCGNQFLGTRPEVLEVWGASALVELKEQWDHFSSLEVLSNLCGYCCRWKMYSNRWRPDKPPSCKLLLGLFLVVMPSDELRLVLQSIWKWVKLPSNSLWYDCAVGWAIGALIAPMSAKLIAQISATGWQEGGASARGPISQYPTDDKDIEVKLKVILWTKSSRSSNDLWDFCQPSVFSSGAWIKRISCHGAKRWERNKWKKILSSNDLSFKKIYP